MSGVWPQSTVPAVRAWLAGQFATVAAGIVGDPITRGVQVFVGAQTVDTDDDLILIVSGRHELQPLTLRGGFTAGSLHETAEITCQVICFGAGSEQPTVVAGRAWDIYGQLAQVVWSDPTLGGLALQASVSQAGDETSLDNQDAACVELTFTVAYTAQI